MVEEWWSKSLHWLAFSSEWFFCMKNINLKSYFSISFAGSKFNWNLKNDHNIQVSNNSENICSLYISQIYEPKIKCRDGGFIFLQKSKIQTVGNTKKKSQLIHFRKSLFFTYEFSQKILNVSSEHSFKLGTIS